jgi:hypothetical protein
LHDSIRRETLSFARSVNLWFPEPNTRELNLFFTALEEASFWLHAHIARNIQED